MTILYGTPDDPAAFDRYYREVHLPIAEAMTGLSRWTLTWTAGQSGELGAATPGIHLVVDLWAETAAAMDEVLASEAGRAASADVPKFATGGVVFLRGDEEEVPVR